jgi:hypothetical protein
VRMDLKRCSYTWHTVIYVIHLLKNVAFRGLEMVIKWIVGDMLGPKNLNKRSLYTKGIHSSK